MVLAKYKGVVTRGRFKADDERKWAMAFCQFEGRRVQVVVEPEKKKRSLSQNAYYHGVVLELLSEHTGEDPEDLHYALRGMFLKKVLDNGMETARSTTELSTTEMEEYLQKIRQWADVFFEGRLYIPAPNEDLTIQ